MELESQPSNPINGSSSSVIPVNQPQSSALPRSLLSKRAQSSFVSNLRSAVAEDGSQEDIDPLLTSRHIGPLASQRAEEEERERVQEDARETRRSSRRSKASQHSTAAQKGISGPGATQMFAYPLPPPSGSSGAPGTPPALVLGTGTRLRIRTPAQSASNAASSAASNSMPDSPASSRAHSQTSSVAHSTIDGRSQSPTSPGLMSPKDEHYQHNRPFVPRNSSPQAANANFPPSPYYRSHGNGNNNSLPAIYRAASVMATSPIGSPGRLPPQLPPASQMQGLPTASSSASRSSDLQRHAKPKRLKAHTVTTKSFSVPVVPRDKDGKPMLPLNVGIMTVISLGEVCMREHFHTERYIFPVGYEVTRRYHSTIDPNAEVVYHCTILDGGDGPKFQIVPSDAPDQTVIAGTATGAWSAIVKKANAIRNRQHSNSVSGPDFFGLGQNSIKHLIQELPSADRLQDYVWQNFVEGGPLGGRHAAVVLALPEEYDATVPIGAYYPDRRQQLAVQNQQQSQNGQQQVQHQPGQQQNSNQSSSNQQSTSHQGLTQIVLPPPTTSDTLTIQEYHPPAAREPDRRTTRASTRMTSASPTPSRSRRSSEHKRTPSASSSRAHAGSRSSSSPSGAATARHSPYPAATDNATSAVPTSFAGLMHDLSGGNLGGPPQDSPPADDGYTTSATE